LEVLERLQASYWDEDDRAETTELNPWLGFSQAIVTQGAIKPVLKRKGWSKAALMDYNLILQVCFLFR